MAKTFQQVVQEEIGGLHMQVLELTTINMQLQEKIAQQETELASLRPSTTKSKEKADARNA